MGREGLVACNVANVNHIHTYIGLHDYEPFLSSCLAKTAVVGVSLWGFECFECFRPSARPRRHQHKPQTHVSQSDLLVHFVRSRIMVGLQGVIFRRSIRASYATLDLELTSNQEAAAAEHPRRHVIVLVQFALNDNNNNNNHKSEATQCRSYFRRAFKLGDEVEIIGGKWIEEAGGGSALVYRKLEVVGFAMPLAIPTKSSSPPSNDSDVRLVRGQVWDNIRCQAARALHYPPSVASATSGENIVKGKQTKRRKINDNAGKSDGTNNIDSHGDKGQGENKTLRHGGGIGKRKQGEILAAFLIEKIASAKFNGSRDEAIAYLNGGSGCIDAAGGSGHVSLGLSLQGVRSTVVDPRPNVGRLPKRDRKALRMAMKRHKARIDTDGQKKDDHNGALNTGDDTDAIDQVSHPPIPFSTFRAWFAERPEGVDLTYREGSKMKNESGDGEGDTLDAGESTDESIPICHMCSSDGLLTDCRAIVALHPDEATGLIVEHAVKYKIPFVVVPCCVFSRIFSSRQVNGKLVETYDELLEYLMNKDPSIEIEELQFGGANKVIFSTFTG